MTTTNQDKNKALFAHLVITLSSSAMQHLGKLVNPMTQKTEVNLEAAEATIDMLQMLKDKTEGNLDQEEKRMIEDAVSSLQLTFVDTKKEAPATDKTEAPANEHTGQAEEKQAETNTNDTEASSMEEGEQKEPRFHKSYGEK